MSIARIYHTKRAQKSPGNCRRCGRTIERGEPYLYFFKGFRSKHKIVWCGSGQHPGPRPSQLESSNLADAYAAQEEAEDSLAQLTGKPGEVSDIEAALSNAADQIQEVANAYREAAEPFGGAGDSADRADTLDDAVQTLGSLQSNEFDPSDVEWCELHTDAAAAESLVDSSINERRSYCTDCMTALDEAKQEHWDEALEEAQAILGEVSF